MDTHITVLVLGLDTIKNEVYIEQNAGCGQDAESCKANPMWITLCDGKGNCDDGTRANHENWLEQVEWMRSRKQSYRLLPVVLEGSALYYLRNHEQLKFTHEGDDDEDDEEDATCACGAFMEECENCGAELCLECDSSCDCENNHPEYGDDFQN